MLKVAIIIATTAVLLSVLNLEMRISEEAPTVLLGDTTYGMKPLVAPVVSGTILSVFSYLVTHSPVASTLKRYLLNDNELWKLRELAWQMQSTVPLSHPMHRLPRAAREGHDHNVQEARQNNFDLDSIIPFVKVVENGSIRNSEILKLHRRFNDKMTTPSVVTEMVLAAISQLQPTYKMFSAAPDVEDLKRQAAASTKRYEAGQALSIFDGIPVAFKDMIKVKGYVLTDGSAYYAHRNEPSTEDDFVVSRFRELGAIIMPPTSMVEGGVTPIGYSVNARGPFNPRNSSHYSGGSSGGSAVAVALGIVPVAIGYDGGGSIRTPAALSGVVGLATGYGRCPFSMADAAMTGTNIKSGPFARTVADAGEWAIDRINRLNRLVRRGEWAPSAVIDLDLWAYVY
jgi:hypothetical protein